MINSPASLQILWCSEYVYMEIVLIVHLMFSYRLCRSLSKVYSLHNVVKFPTFCICFLSRFLDLYIVCAVSDCAWFLLLLLLVAPGRRWHLQLPGFKKNKSKFHFYSVQSVPAVFFSMISRNILRYDFKTRCPYCNIPKPPCFSP